VNAFVPGTLTNVTRSADVIIGLMLVLLAHGLRRRKRRAWQAVVALLVFDIVIHSLHFPHEPRGVIVVLEAEHLCMSMRGVRKPGAKTVTSAVRGIFRRDARTRAEAMSMLFGHG
ncbi:MAG TPA: GTP cyclohydrolase I, partial [Trebonia sp.]|nr:GTP cyclohydrolase I [Trebonia sp.]